LALRAPAVLVVLVLPLALFLYHYAPQVFPRAIASGGGPSLRVLTFNVSGNHRRGEAESVLRVVEAEQPDVVALQEARASTREALAAALGDAYPYQVSTSDVATLSRFPFLAVEDLQLPGNAYVNQRAEVLVDDRVVVLSNVHIKRPTAGLSARQTLLPWLRRYDTEWRDTPVGALVDDLTRTMGPHIVVGDFNQTEWSASYAQLTTVLRDSFREVGWGFGHTYPSAIGSGTWDVPLPLLRLDYVFHSPEISALGAHVGPAADSYHLPVVADLQVR
jgi:endonuclease/exonuclease/phosphatase (EEP) superfamily protein YafD